MEPSIEYDPEWFVWYRDNVPQGEEPLEDDSDSQWLREQIIVSNIYLCKRVVGKMKKTMPTHVERDDLESWAKIGLMQAVTRFDTSLGVPFEAFATQRMRSVIMDGIRDADWAPRSLRKKQRDVTKLEEAFRQNKGREPTLEEIARILVFEKFQSDAATLVIDDLEEEIESMIEEISTTKYHSEIASHTYIEGSLEAQNKPTSLNEDEDELVSVLKATVGKALKDMSVRKAAIIALHYYDDKKLSDIATKLKMSEVRVGNMHADAVLEIWKEIQSVLYGG